MEKARTPFHPELKGWAFSVSEFSKTRWGASDSLDDYALAQVITRQSYIGRLCSSLPAGPLGLIDIGTQLLVEMPNLAIKLYKTSGLFGWA